jgi:hypothetical protein
MARRYYLGLALLVSSAPLLCQVEPSATGGSGTSDDDSYMTLPPAVSGAFYPSSVGSQERSNLLSGGVLTTGAYDTNVLAGDSVKPVAAESVTILPNIQIAAKTARLSASLSYNPGFIFFTPTTDLNEVTQNAVADFSYRWTKRVTVGAQEVFRQNSTVFSEPYTISGSTISNSASYTSPIVIAPYAGQITESTNGHIGYQFSRSSMIGASGYFSTFQFSNTAQSEGLFNSNGGGGSAFYSHRLTRTQSIGFSYGYSLTKSNPYVSTISSHTGLAFYSFYLGSGFSLTFRGGPEYTTSSAPGVAATSTWAPSGSAGIGWSRPRVGFALNYSRSVTTGWGLLGAYTADNANANVRYQFRRRLIGGLNGNYGNTRNATPQIATYTTTGHTLFGRASLDYLMGEHVRLVGEYSHVHNDYSDITALSSSPSDDRVALTVSYQFHRPLGR